MSGRLKEVEGDGQRLLLSSLQGLFSTELICCEMRLHCLDSSPMHCEDCDEEDRNSGYIFISSLYIYIYMYFTHITMAAPTELLHFCNFPYDLLFNENVT